MQLLREERCSPFGILAALWTANSGMNSLENALNAVYKVKQSRALWKTYGIALILTVSASMLIIAALTVFLYGGALIQLISNTIGLKTAFCWIWKLAQWPIAVSLVASTAYYAAPSLKKRRWQWLIPGALFARLPPPIAASLLPFLYQPRKDLRFAWRGHGPHDLALRYRDHVVGRCGSQQGHRSGGSSC